MVQCIATIKKFAEKGEKTGWTYVDIPYNLANEILPNTKKSFRVKGKINGIVFEKMSLYPMGDGNFIFAINAELRKKLKINTGDTATILLQYDDAKAELPTVFVELLEEDEQAKTFFYALPKTAKSNYKHFMLGAKSENAKAKNIAMVLNALAHKMTPREMIDTEKMRKGLL